MTPRDRSQLRIDLHSHTSWSSDALTTPGELVHQARAAGLDRIAITDHGTIRGALDAQQIDPELVIVGEEMKCSCGTDLIGLFLRQRVPNGLSLEDTAQAIRDQDGVVYAPHPFAYILGATRRARRLAKLADMFEVYNARAFYPRWNRQARRLMHEGSLPGGAGSDAHFVWEIGRAYTRIPSFVSAADFRQVMPEARPHLRIVSSPALHVASLALHGWATMRHRIPRPQPKEIVSEA